MCIFLILIFFIIIPGRLLNNPWAQPPEPTDWEIQPTAPRHEVPYYLASLWDSHYAQIAASKSKSKSAKKGDGDEFPIPKDLRAKLKHARAARGMLKDIEVEIRSFIEEFHRGQSSVHNKRQGTRRRASISSSSSSSSMSHVKCDDVSDPIDETVSEDSFGSVDSDGFVIVNRDRTAGKGSVTEQQPQMLDQRMIFDGSVEDQTASFAYVVENHPFPFFLMFNVSWCIANLCLLPFCNSRWIVHSLAAYYGLSTWSVTSGERREAYVGIPRLPAHAKARTKKRSTSSSASTTVSAPILPQPLWMSI